MRLPKEFTFKQGNVIHRMVYNKETQFFHDAANEKYQITPRRCQFYLKHGGGPAHLGQVICQALIDAVWKEDLDKVIGDEIPNRDNK